MGRGNVLALALALAAPIGCAKRPYLFGERMPDHCKGAGQNSEQCVGWVFDRMMMATSLSAYEDRKVTDYVTEVGARLVRASGDKRPWTFRVLDSDEVQAFAGLATTVYVNRGAIAVLRSEAELAAVIGHEIGHVIGGHVRENFYEYRRDIERTRTSWENDNRYARDDEIQADEFAAMILSRAGYDPTGVVMMLRSYATTSPGDGDDESDHHPRWNERIARAQILAARLPGKETGEARFRERIKELVVGDDPRTAFVMRDVAVFGHAGFAVDLPRREATHVEKSSVMVKVDDDTAIDIRPIHRGLAKVFPTKPDQNGTAAATIDGPKLALAITVTGPNAAAIVSDLRKRVRLPREAELRSLNPKRVDLNAPRVLWLP